MQLGWPMLLKQHFASRFITLTLYCFSLNQQAWISVFQNSSVLVLTDILPLLIFPFIKLLLLSWLILMNRIFHRLFPGHQIIGDYKSVAVFAKDQAFPSSIINFIIIIILDKLQFFKFVVYFLVVFIPFGRKAFYFGSFLPLNSFRAVPCALCMSWVCTVF